MDKPDLDPVAAANAAVNAAQKTLSELIGQRDAVTAREQQLSAERGKIAFAAHGDCNTKAKTRLAAIHRELPEIGSEVASFDAAIDEAQTRVASAQQQHRREVERERRSSISTNCSLTRTPPMRHYASISPPSSRLTSARNGCVRSPAAPAGTSCARR